MMCDSIKTTKLIVVFSFVWSLGYFIFLPVELLFQLAKYEISSLLRTDYLTQEIKIWKNMIQKT